MATLEEIKQRLKQAESKPAEPSLKEQEQAQLIRLLQGSMVDAKACITLEPQYNFNGGPPLISDLVCPDCGATNLHHLSVELFNRDEDNTQGDHITVVVPESHGWGWDNGLEAVPQSNVDGDMSRNPSMRRTGIIINFHCEDCGTRPGMTIAQHKGTTHMGWSYKAYRKHSK